MEMTTGDHHASQITTHTNDIEHSITTELTADEQPSPSRLMLLPTELRLDIYGDVVADITIHENRIQRPQSLFTCKQIQREMLPVYAKQLKDLEEDLNARSNLHFHNMQVLKQAYRPGLLRADKYRSELSGYVESMAELKAVGEEMGKLEKWM